MIVAARRNTTTIPSPRRRDDAEYGRPAPARQPLSQPQPAPPVTPVVDDVSRAIASEALRLRHARTQAQATALEYDLTELISAYTRMATRYGYADPALAQLRDALRFFQNRYRALLAQMHTDWVRIAALELTPPPSAAALV